MTDQHQCSSHQDVTTSLLIPKPGTKHPVALQRPAPAPLRGLAALEGSGMPYCSRSYKYRGKEVSSYTLLPHPRRKEHGRALSSSGPSHQQSQGIQGKILASARIFCIILLSPTRKHFR